MKPPYAGQQYMARQQFQRPKVVIPKRRKHLFALSKLIECRDDSQENIECRRELQSDS